MHKYNRVLEVLSLKKISYSFDEISKISNIPKTTVFRWVNLYYDNYINLQKRYDKQHNDKINNFIKSIGNDVFDYIIEHVKKNPFIIQKELMLLINTKFNLHIHFSNIKYILRHIGITKKTCKKRVIKTETFLNELIEKRNKFIKLIKEEIRDLIVCIDETGIKSFFSSCLKGYSKKGEVINMPVAELKITNNSLIMAITTKGIISYNISNEFTNHVVYGKFIEDTIKKLEINKKYLFLFDNVSFHNNKTILDKIINSGNKYMFLPSYSPDLNPIENVNSIIKGKIHKLILNDCIDGNFLTNIKKTHDAEQRSNKTINTLMSDNEKLILKNTLKTIKMDARTEKKNIVKENIKNIKITNKNDMHQSIKIMKNNENTKSKEIVKSRIKEEKEKTKKKIKEQKKHLGSIIKAYVDLSITNLITNMMQQKLIIFLKERLHLIIQKYTVN
jgi:hypothetical protein